MAKLRYLTRRWAAFDLRYTDWRGALPDAGYNLHSLNRYAKHRSCSLVNSLEIYDLKNGLSSCSTEADTAQFRFSHVLVLPAKQCNACMGNEPAIFGPEMIGATRCANTVFICQRSESRSMHSRSPLVRDICGTSLFLASLFRW